MLLRGVIGGDGTATCERASATGAAMTMLAARRHVNRATGPTASWIICWRMKPRIFLGSSGKQAKLIQAVTRGLEDIADVEPWTTVFNPGVSTLDRLVELTREVDFAAFVFAQDDWTSSAADATAGGSASPRDNVVFEAGLFGGALGMRRTFILHAKGAKLPTDLLGMTAVRYPEALTAADMRGVNQKLRKAIEDEGRLSRLEGDWWQHSLTIRSEREPSAISLLRISRDRAGGLEVAGRGWQEDGTLSSRYWSVASKEHHEPPGIFYFWNGERPRHPNAPQLEGTGEIRLEGADRASGYWTTRSEVDPQLRERTSGVYLRANSGDMQLLDGGDPEARADLLALRLREWKAIVNS
jgi:predicted nucleotide-binding protein